MQVARLREPVAESDIPVTRSEWLLATGVPRSRVAKLAKTFGPLTYDPKLLASFATDKFRLSAISVDDCGARGSRAFLLVASNARGPRAPQEWQRAKWFRDIDCRVGKGFSNAVRACLYDGLPAEPKLLASFATGSSDLLIAARILERSSNSTINRNAFALRHSMCVESLQRTA